MESVTVRGFAFVNFSKSERRNYLEWRRDNLAYAEQLRRGDAVMLVSKLRHAIVFAHGFHRVLDEVGRPHLVFHLSKHVISGHIDERGVEHGRGQLFSPYMIDQYGKACGLHIKCPKTLAEHLEWLGETDYIHPVLVERHLKLVK